MLEKQAACWAMDHYSTFLRGQKCILNIENKPIEKLGMVHKKTLSRHNEYMNR
jgi:hypothetical protein